MKIKENVIQLPEQSPVDRQRLHIERQASEIKDQAKKIAEMMGQEVDGEEIGTR